MPLTTEQERANSRLQLGALWAAMILLDTAAQLLFKSAAGALAPPAFSLQWVHMVAQSIRFWEAALCLVLTFPIWMLILRQSRLGPSFAATAFTNVGVIGGSLIVFGESISSVHYAGIALIIIGVALLSRLET
jgi:multidrug transporter EmrE-like cation transporter